MPWRSLQINSKCNSTRNVLIWHMVKMTNEVVQKKCSSWDLSVNRIDAFIRPIMPSSRVKFTFKHVRNFWALHASLCTRVLLPSFCLITSMYVLDKSCICYTVIGWKSVNSWIPSQPLFICWSSDFYFFSKRSWHNVGRSKLNPGLSPLSRTICRGQNQGSLCRMQQWSRDDRTHEPMFFREGLSRFAVMKSTRE